MYSTRSNLILGFHGCEKSEQTKLISNSSYIKSSNESFDWLGHGMYFWENNPRRGLLSKIKNQKSRRFPDHSVFKKRFCPMQNAAKRNLGKGA